MLKHVIWIAAYAPIPPFNGTSVKSAGIIEGLAKYVPISVVFSTPQGTESESVRKCQAYWQSRGRVQFHSVSARSPAWRWLAPLQFKFLNESTINLQAIRRQISRLQHQYTGSAIVLDDALLSRLLLDLKDPVIHSPHDCLSKLFRIECEKSHQLADKIRFLYRYLVVKRYESTYYQLASLVHVVGQHDGEELMLINKNIRLLVCSNAGLLPVAPSTTGTIRDIDILIWGNINSAPIREGIDQLWRCLAAQAPQWEHRKIVVLGRVKSDDCPTPPEHLNIEYKEVELDLPALLQRTRVCVLPDTDGMGIKNRAIDCLSQGVCLIGLPAMLAALPAPRHYCRSVADIDQMPLEVETLLRCGDDTRLGALAKAVFQEHLSPAAIGDIFFNRLSALQQIYTNTHD